jgi:chromosome segregation ATPase
VNSSIDEPEYKKGSIVRLTMKNFVTYHDAEIRPGPQMNVVIGPNGTGKSTLVCAMVLGLGGKPAVLGRAKEPRDFIKHGEDTAIIECELYGGKGASHNSVIRRKIFNDNSSTWKVNGRDSTQKEVLAFVKKLNVQVENLCQFLPQDRVSSFAAMDPMQLLHETEMAINEQLEETHKELIQLKKDETESRINFDTQTKVLVDLKTQNAALERDVLRFQERERLMSELNLLESKRPWVAFESSRLHAVALQQAYKNLVEELKKADEALEPLQIDAQEKAVAAQQGASAVAEMTKEIITLTTQRAQIIEKMKTLAEKTTSLENKLAQVDATEERRLQQLAKMTKNVEELRRQIAHVEDAEAERQANLEKWSAEIEKIKEKEKEAGANLKAVSSQLPPLEDQRRKVDASMKEQTRIRERQMADTKSNAQDSWRLREFVLGDGAKHFKGAIYGPMCLYIKVATSQHATWIDKVLNFSQITGFVVEFSSDRDILEAHCKQNNITVPAIYFSDRAGSKLPRPVKTKYLEDFGLQGYLDQLIAAPPLVKWTLCNIARLHSIPWSTDSQLASSKIPELQAQARGDVSIRRWVSPTSHYQLKPSHHSNFVLVSTEPLPNNRWKFVPPTGTHTAEEIQRTLADLDGQLKQLSEQANVAKMTMNKVKQDMVHASSQLKAAQHNDVRSLQIKLKQAEAELKELDKDVEAERDAIRVQIVSSLTARVAPALALRDLSPKWVGASVTAAEHLLKRGFLKNLAEQAMETLRNAQQENMDLREQVTASGALFEAAKEQTRILKVEAAKKVTRTPELEAEWATLPETLDELDVRIDNNRLRINAISHNPAIMEKYNQRREEIERLEGVLENHGQVLNEKQERIAHLKVEWMPQIEKIVKDIDSNFAQFFSEIGCVGNVRLASEGDNFDKYGINIWVSYRATDEPKQLDARVQSGGERSVATMLYLIALQQLSECPFRLVDEINQGMDPHNERMIFDQVTAQASKPNTPQYFLITPKLLPDLKFTPAITVLCVFNGPFMVDQKNWVVSGLT